MGSDKDSLCSAQVFRVEPAVSILPALLYGALLGLLCGICRHKAAVPRGTQGFALCHVALAPSSGDPGKGCRTPANPGAVCRPGNRRWGSQGWVMHSRQGTGQCKSCENPALKAPALSMGARQTRLLLVVPSACLFPGLFLVGITAGIPENHTLK